MVNRQSDTSVFEIVWNNSNDALFTVDYEGRILLANPAFTKLLGWEPKDLKTPDHFIFQNKEEYEILLDTLRSGKNVPHYITKRKEKTEKYWIFWLPMVQ